MFGDFLLGSFQPKGLSTTKWPRGKENLHCFASASDGESLDWRGPAMETEQSRAEERRGDE
jgi:hypothetical protein